MSRRFRKPWSHPKMGDVEARLIKTAAMIEGPEQLRDIMDAAPPHVAAAWLEKVRPHLKFEVPETVATIE